ncbi:Crp/Fnr family transcriptional regulator [Aeromonas schubertii]|uniref:cAMP-binding protein n=1 Tax=Aeromonas schubertii TaxID=652 RepID=A0A0S2SIZ3_9GAMM|nr:cyclic nucleotide-binding domain-containing protein [Aeromonas schubertii]ALP41650.1 cAMP-binding protein [Aeromonas schubertii]
MQRTPYPHPRFGEALSRLQPRFDAMLATCRLHTRRFLPGERMLTQGEPLHELLRVPAGRIAFYSGVASGRLFQLGEVECHDQILGEMELFGGTPIQWSVEARSELDAEVIDVGRLCIQLEQAPELLLFFTCALAGDYLDSLEITTQRLLLPIAYNIALELWHAKRRTPMLGSRQSALEAARFGTTERVYRRAVGELIALGLVEKREGELIIRDHAALRAYLKL